MKNLITPLLFVFIAQVTFADILIVDDDYADYPDADFDSIQDALDASTAGDEIAVYPGTYIGTGQMVLDVPTHQLVIRSTCGAEQTIIDAENQRVGVLFRSGTPAVTLFEGFTIRNGTYFNGGGLLIHGGPTVRDCIVTGNHATNGGGISCFGNPTIENCVVRNNTSSQAGGGVHIQANLGASFTNCSIIENVSGQNGGGVYIQSSYGNFDNCTIANNSSGHTGGGIFCYGSGNDITVLDNCFVSGNNQPEQFSDGSGIDSSNGEVGIYNTLVCDNYPHEFGDQAYGTLDFGGNTISAGCPVGACCLPDGNCIYSDPSECAALVDFSQWQGIASSCADCDPVTAGACCYTDNGAMVCQQYDQKTCYFLGGTWSLGDSCECVPCEAPPAIGACCFADGSCVLMDSETCYSFEDGQWLGDGTSCEACEPEPTGACCFEGAAGLVCQETEQSWCLEMNGDWSQDAYCKEIKCIPVIPIGACCVYYEDFGNWYCEELTEADCIASHPSSGPWYGSNTNCQGEYVECEQWGGGDQGVCCYQDDCNSVCDMMSQIDCDSIFNGSYFPNDPTCETVICPPPSEDLGACCYQGDAGLRCSETDENLCSTLMGIWYPGMSCECIDCSSSPTGACCYMDSGGYMRCIELTEANCEDKTSSSYAGNYTTCVDVICYNPIGACCIAGKCILTSESQCNIASGIYNGNGVTCAIVDCLYCKEDLDGDGDVDVADLLLLIAAWGVCP